MRRRATIVDRSLPARIIATISIVGVPFIRPTGGGLVPDAATAIVSALGLLVIITGKLTLGRSFGGPYSGFTDDISAFAMAAAGTWASAYALQVGGHVRIDLLLPYLPPPLRAALDQLAVALAGLFAALLALYAWELVAGSWRLGAHSISVLQAPLVIPQSLLAFGLTMLAVQAAALLLARWFGIHDIPDDSGGAAT